MKYFYGILTACSCLIYACSGDSQTSVLTLRTGHMEMSIGAQGQVLSLSDLASGENYLTQDTITSLMAIRVDNKMIRPRAATVENETLTLQFDQDIQATISVEEKPNYLTFELTSITPENSVELITWGPYYSRIGQVIGETVGVVRNDDFALGIQSLNLKTLGGYPWNESDRMPAFDIFRANNPTDMHPDADGSVLYRVEAAKPTRAGSSLQAYTRNRREERVIQDFNHEKIMAPAYDDGGLVGSKIALFGCSTQEALPLIGELEIAEGLPHPMINGQWGKTAPEAASAYLITEFTEDNVDQAIALTKQAGLKYLYHYGKTFDSWGHFELYEGEFPSGIAGLKRCVEKAEAEGIKLGTHFLSNFITTNDPYVTPVPDKRLAIVGSSVITESVSAEASEIPVSSPEFFNQMKNNTLKTVRIQDELIRYGSVSDSEPWRLLDCQRGAFETRAVSHEEGDTIVKLLDHAYKVFLTNAELTVEMSEKMAEIYNQTGLRQISFDGLEGNRSTGLGTYGETLMPYTWYNSLSDDLKDHLIIDASRTTHFFWHIYSRMNWGEPWYGGFRESQKAYRFNNQAYFQRNYMPGMLGWFKMTPTTSVEDVEWLLAKSAGYDAGYALVTGNEEVEKNGNSEQILALIGEWEKLRIGQAFTETQKELMRDTTQEFSLVAEAPGTWSLVRFNSKIYTHQYRDLQPGQPLYSTFDIDNAGEEQPLQFTLTANRSDVNNITLEIDSYKEYTLPVTLLEGQKIKYSAGDHLVVYDAFWQKVSEHTVDPDALSVDKGTHTVTVSCDFTGNDDASNLKVELRTITDQEKVTFSQDI